MAPRNASSRRGKKRTTADIHKHATGATALHVKDGKGAHVVACENLRVLITKEDGAWVAQGLEIDYAIDGATVQEAKQRFQNGLAMTIESHLRVNGNIRDLLRNAPDEVWTEYFDAKHALHRHRHSQVMVATIPQNQADLPFDQIVFVTKGDEKAA